MALVFSKMSPQKAKDLLKFTRQWIKNDDLNIHAIPDVCFLFLLLLGSSFLYNLCKITFEMNECSFDSLSLTPDA